MDICREFIRLGLVFGYLLFCVVGFVYGEEGLLLAFGFLIVLNLLVIIFFVTPFQVHKALFFGINSDFAKRKVYGARGTYHVRIRSIIDDRHKKRYLELYQPVTYNIIKTVDITNKDETQPVKSVRNVVQEYEEELRQLEEVNMQKKWKKQAVKWDQKHWDGNVYNGDLDM
ncbi:hypothetical protein [Salibacterium aidingense]|uniref:hypothetical protein n=1 Tax=Salibacterium aidingense TaxID=384933 RepID=UPI00047D9DDB|nr:hypothetical protein [Salibacterium aidingense]